MKRISIVLLIMMLARITCFSSTTLTPTEQDSIVVSTSDLKYANLIFVEHNKLLNENALLHNQIKNYIDLNKQLVQVDSLRIQQLYEYNKLSQSYVNQIDALNEEVKKKNRAIRYWQIGGITVSVGLILFLLLK